MKKLILLITVVSIFFGCSRHTYWVRNKSKVYVDTLQTLKCGNTGKFLNLQYLGCGGLFLKSGNHAIMIDPFFSNPSLLNVIGSGLFHGIKIKSNPNSINIGINKIKNVFGDSALDSVTSMISAHSHYDHLMDFPFLFEKGITQKSKCKIYTNDSGINILGNVIPSETLVSMEKFAANKYKQGTWIITSFNGEDTIKILPILAGHNAHFGGNNLQNKECSKGFKPFGLKFFTGNTVYNDKTFSNPLSKTNVNYWKEGQTFSFLVDLIKGNNTVFRIFIQSSSCDEFYGIPPQQVLYEKQVDLAILGVASYQFSCRYPKTLIEVLSPQKVIFVHWEDFFLPYKPGKSVPVVATDVKLLLGKGFNERVGIKREDCSMPEIGVSYKIFY